MTETGNVPQDPKHRLVAQIMGAGAFVAIVSTFVKWASVSLDITSLGGRMAAESKTGLETSDGKIVLVVALTLIVFAVMIYSRRVQGKVFPAIGIALAAIVLLITIIDITTTKKDTREEFEAELKKSTQADTPVIKELSKHLEVSLGPGLYIAVAGGALMLAGSALGLGLRKPEEFAETPPAPPSMETPPPPPPPED